jgi:hypothetical protein
LEPLQSGKAPLETAPDYIAPPTALASNSIPRGLTDPLGFFRLLFCDVILSMIIKNTNLYGN